MIAILLIVAAIVGFPLVAIVVDFIYFLTKGERYFTKKVFVLDFWIMMIGPFYFMAMDFDTRNNCCSDSAFFSPAHRLSVYVLILLCIVVFFYCSLRKKIASPVLEVVVNCLLLTGIVFNIFMIIQFGEPIAGVLGNVPVMLVMILMLVKNHRLMLESIEDGGAADSQRGIAWICLSVLRLKPLAKIPVLLVLCLPLLVCFAGILMLFGQRPDAMVRAFTETYKHGLSQMNSDCNGVVCGGHFLCTIAAKGSPSLVKPVRVGIRAGAPIKCNRQLLVSNAFEEWLEERMPAIHRPVRRFYNRIGGLIHRYYGAFDRAWVSNLVYILMKPLEWSFLLVLYVADRAPENRIAQQYMSRPDRARIRMASGMIN